MNTNFNNYVKKVQTQFNQPALDHSTDYKNMALQLHIVAKKYDNMMGRDVYTCIIETMSYIETLSNMYKNTSVPEYELKELKRLIFTEISAVVYELENLQISFPDDEKATLIESFKILSNKFLIR